MQQERAVQKDFNKHAEILDVMSILRTHRFKKVVMFMSQLMKSGYLQVISD